MHEYDVLQTVHDFMGDLLNEDRVGVPTYVVPQKKTRSNKCILERVRRMAVFEQPHHMGRVEAEKNDGKSPTDVLNAVNRVNGDRNLVMIELAYPKRRE